MFLSDPLPHRPLGGVGDFNPHGLELVPDGVGPGPILGLFGLGPPGHQGVDLGVPLGGGGGGGLLLPEGGGLLQQVQPQDGIEAGDEGPLGGVDVYKRQG